MNVQANEREAQRVETSSNVQESRTVIRPRMYRDQERVYRERGRSGDKEHTYINQEGREEERTGIKNGSMGLLQSAPGNENQKGKLEDGERRQVTCVYVCYSTIQLEAVMTGPTPSTVLFDRVLCCCHLGSYLLNCT
ncbi:hypothetical protein Pmani_018302 [Petrolisthes manimaculis]|uniref:Uncharacterized protein n=1 Tax=Petrolisthes manimaculis TaxID=1843537 RepID=A0AAE1PMQ8_9EUCA|nr:hypothetical protein Pmani_018302 [Petrolisthes manimaculis]